MSETTGFKVDTTPSNKEQLGPEEAQEEANMMRAKAGVRPETGKTHRSDKYDPKGRETLPEDYDKALEVVEEMKQLAANEPSAEKVVLQLGRVVEKTRYIVVGLLKLPAGILEAVSGGLVEESFDIKHEDLMKRLESASKQLRDLKKEAKAFEK